MNNKIIFIILIIVFVIIIYFICKNEKFTSTQSNNNNNDDDNNNINSFYTPIKNIFLTNNYYNYQDNKPKKNFKIPESLEKIKLDSFIYSKPTSQKIICSSHTNRADCWEDNVNNCQWVYKIDNGSYCDVAPIWIL